MTVGNAGRDLCVYLLLLPFLDFLMATPRIIGRPGNKQKGAVVALSVLAAVSAVKIGIELNGKEPSLYDQIDVLPGAPSSDLKKGYKRASLKVHPDKVAAAQAAGEADALDAESADEAFVQLKAAYDTLNVPEKRDLYNKFGQAGLDFDGTDTTKLFAGLGFFYVMWLAIAYLLTRRKAFGRAQTWTFTGLMALAIFEYQACVGGQDFLEDQLPQLAIFEKVELLHRCYPVYLLAARIVAWMLFEDLEAHAFAMLQQLHWKVDRLRERVVIMSHEGVAPVGVSVPGAASAGAEAKIPAIGMDGAITPEMWRDLAKANAAAAPAIRAAGGGALGVKTDNEVINRIRKAAAEGKTEEQLAAEEQAKDGGAAGAAVLPGGMAPVAKPAPAAKAAGGGRSIMSLVWFFGVYFFFQWLLGRGQ